MKIMVTGGAGFIGSNVVDGYIRQGHEVVVLDNLSTGKKENLNPGARFYEVDIRSKDLGSVMAKERPEILNHHAAQISVPASVSDPRLDADINLMGLLNVLENAVRYGVKKIIFISSGGAIYGEAEEYPTTEDYYPRPLSPYAVSKYCSEFYLDYYRHRKGLDFTTLRYSNIYGPRQIPHGEAGVVAIFMENLLEGRPSILNHFPDDPDGMIRDYCFVGDVVGANLKALDKGSGDFFNIGSGRGTKTLELYRTIYAALREIRPQTPHEPAELRREGARAGDIRKSCLVVEKARTLLDWIPRTDLRQGIRKTLEWWTGKEQSP
ncbi:MAG: NAD-dependent epimerase/dehydratase family protein [Deltaproteobacteria bacterium]|nr:NAD-dependent epimerase/dehydratase family protein [Deltaproteobacteria bacterium]MBW2139174.1 NAD-dependent epimerase/dehydratase family protein [Deltaproteobacteria bacterium]